MGRWNLRRKFKRRGVDCVIMLTQPRVVMEVASPLSVNFALQRRKASGSTRVWRRPFRD